MAGVAYQVVGTPVTAGATLNVTGLGERSGNLVRLQSALAQQVPVLPCIRRFRGCHVGAAPVAQMTGCQVDMVELLRSLSGAQSMCSTRLMPARLPHWLFAASVYV